MGAIAWRATKLNDWGDYNCHGRSDGQAGRVGCMVKTASDVGATAIFIYESQGGYDKTSNEGWKLKSFDRSCQGCLSNMKIEKISLVF